MLINHNCGSLSEIEVLILCGGFGSRLRPVVNDRPKGLAMIAGRPFLDILVDELLSKGLRRFIFCTGHGGDQILAHFVGRKDAEFEFSYESMPLGTAGAIRNARKHIRSDTFIVVNGDSFCEVSYSRLLSFHFNKNSLLTVVVVPASERKDVGLLTLGENDHILSFDEKREFLEGYKYFVNAGIYVMKRRFVNEMQDVTPLSLENEVFPSVAGEGRSFGYRVSCDLTDIGTPERYFRAQDDKRGIQ